MLTFIPWADSPAVIAALGILLMVSVPLLGSIVARLCRVYRVLKQHEGRIA